MIAIKNCLEDYKGFVNIIKRISVIQIMMNCFMFTCHAAYQGPLIGIKDILVLILILIEYNYIIIIVFAKYTHMGQANTKNKNNAKK